MPTIAENLNRIRAQVDGHAVLHQRPSGSVRLLAVSKTFPVEDVRLAYRVGQRMFGENRVVELEKKAPILPADVEWHLIGHLQSNKAVRAAKVAHWVHSLDSESTIRKLGSAAATFGKIISVLLELHLTDEPTKSGITHYEDLLRLARFTLTYPALRLQGLMTMAPLGAPSEVNRNIFARLRGIRDRLQAELNHPLPELSMGMSGDFREAIEEGATLVRIGTAIFGNR